MRNVCLVASLLALCGCWQACAEPFDPNQEREWNFLGQPKFTGKLVKIERGMVQVRTADGAVKEFQPGTAEGMTGSYIQRAMAKFPSAPTAPKLTLGEGALIDLSAAELPLGPLSQWKNKGRINGSFLVMNQPPNVEQVQGRKAVVFAHAPWLMPLEYETLVSDFYMPVEAIGNEQMTVVAWLCNTGPVVDRETFLCWGEKDCGELDSPDFSYGCYEAMQWYDDKMVIPAARFPKLNAWHQLAFVVRPSEKDKNRLELKLFVDGEQTAMKLVRKPARKLLDNNLAFIGCAWEAWWGKKWATRPARPYTGAIAGIKVFDRALNEAELRRLNGSSVHETPVARSTAKVEATQPVPSDGTREVQTTLLRLSWKPHPEALSQLLHFGTDRAEVARGGPGGLKLKPYTDEAYIPIDLKREKLDSGQTYYWRVEQVTEPKQTTSASEPWSFITSRFDLEADNPVSEEFPKEMKQDGFYSRFMEAGGYPIISPPGNHDVHMRAARFALQKILGKRPDLVLALQGSRAATHLASKENRGWGWSHFTCSSYGEGEAILREGAIIIHEMGHQFHMQGAEQMEPDFRQRLGTVFDTSRLERRWIGDYGGLNMWENVAVAASWWINDMTQDEGELRPRELLRRSDPQLFHLLSAYWPGDLLIDLHPGRGLKTDAAGQCLEWGNSGGVDFFKPNAGWRFYERTRGCFVPQAGKPSFRTVAGVPALTFSGKQSLAWDKTTWDALDGNRAWSVEAWAYRDRAATGEQTLVSWGAAGATEVKLLWGASEQAYQLPGGVSCKWTHKPEPGQWHHLLWVYTGGGAAEGEGELRLYVDGKLDGKATCKLALSPKARIVIGESFTGALAHARIYDYDLHPLQINALYQREAPAYRPAPSIVGERLLVNLDVSQVSPVDDPDTWPLYPASLAKPWLRSWVNLGLLGGKMHNDAQAPGESRPLVTVTNQARAITFDGKSRFISSFNAPNPMEGTVELWAFPEAGSEQATLLQWGTWSVPGKLLRPGHWSHVAITFTKSGATAYVNGQKAPSVTTAMLGTGADRLIVGGAWTGRGWSSNFKGHLAGVRIYQDVLTPEQIRTAIVASDCMRPSIPIPAVDSEVVASRKPALTWQIGAGASDTRGDLYMGTQASVVAAADRSSPAYQGIKKSGECRPLLKPGTRYYWRIDRLTSAGKPSVASEVWSFKTAEEIVLDLDAATVPSGPVTKWANKGSAGGVFTLEESSTAKPPQSDLVEGRKAVTFDGQASVFKSSTLTPTSVTGDHPLTVEMWVKNPGMAECETILGLAPSVAMKGFDKERMNCAANFSFGSGHEKNRDLRPGFFTCGMPGGNVGWKEEGFWTKATEWTHVAHVFTGGYRGNFKVYVNGKLVNDKGFMTLNTVGGYPMYLGAAWNTALGGSNKFSGSLARLKVYDYARTETEILAAAQEK